MKSLTVVEFLSVSANGNTDGILWAIETFQSDGEYGPVPAILRAYDAENVLNELYNSVINTGDNVGLYSLFVPPTIANGHVFVPTISYPPSNLCFVHVYGLLAPRIIIQPASSIYVKAIGGVISLSVLATGLQPLGYQWYQGMSGDTSNPISGAILSDLQMTISQATYLWVQVSNDQGTANSFASVITGVLTSGSTGSIGTTGSTATTATTGSTGTTAVTTGTTVLSESVMLSFSFVLFAVVGIISFM